MAPFFFPTGKTCVAASDSRVGEACCYLHHPKGAAGKCEGAWRMHRWKGRIGADSEVTSREVQSKLYVVEQIVYYSAESVVAAQKKTNGRQRLASRGRDDRQH